MIELFILLLFLIIFLHVIEHRYSLRFSSVLSDKNEKMLLLFVNRKGSTIKRDYIILLKIKQ